MNIKKLLVGATAGAMMLAFAMPALAEKPTKSCKSIQSGTLLDSKGNTIILGYDQMGI